MMGRKATLTSLLARTVLLFIGLLQLWSFVIVGHQQQLDPPHQASLTSNRVVATRAVTQKEHDAIYPAAAKKLRTTHGREETAKIGGIGGKSSGLKLPVRRIGEKPLSSLVNINKPRTKNEIEATGLRVDSKAMKPTLLQVFVVTAPTKQVYRDRFLANAIGWHRHFVPHLPVFTFDQDAPSTLYDDQPITVIPTLGDFETNSKRNNLLMASFGAAYDYNPNAHYYMLTEDDTILAPQNLMRAITGMHNNSQKQSNIYMGKCVATSSGRAFVMGGSGIIMSNDVVRRLRPQLEDCRRQFYNFQHGDTRIAKCLDYLKIVKRNYETCSGFQFSSASPWWEAKQRYAANIPFITLHEKDPERIRYLNCAIQDLVDKNESIKFSTLQPYLDAYGNETKST